MRLTDMCHDWLKASLNHGDMVIDATLGNGHDAFFLAQHIGAEGQLFGFDVQAQAIKQSKLKLITQPCQQTLFQQGHEHLSSAMPASTQGNIKVIMFNLGWLPSSDKSIITQASTTIAALQQSLHWLAVSGKLTIMVYPGHVGGESEAKAVSNWLEQTCLASKQALSLKQIKVPNRPTAPILLQLQKQAAYSCYL